MPINVRIMGNGEEKFTTENTEGTEIEKLKADPQISWIRGLNYPQTCPPIFVEDFADYTD